MKDPLKHTDTSTVNTALKFPYGIADFNKLISQGYFYADRSRYITLLENEADHLLFLRPRRFGKSLLLGMLANYYDIAQANRFEELFGHLHIGKNPSPRHNQYFILRWDFSMVASQGSTAEIKQALHDHLNAAARSFITNYQMRLKQDIVLQHDNGLVALHSIVDAVRQQDKALYLLIDEYDNFANEVMMARQSDYPTLVHGEGILKTIFKTIKGLSGGQGIDRVFITGVSPVVMSDISSGYNVAKNITLRPEYAALCGFHEQELADVLLRITQEFKVSQEKADEALDMMRTFYNGYRFAENHCECVYNPTLVLYFLDIFIRDCEYPRQMLDHNLAMDRNRIKYIAGLPHGQTIIARILDPENPPKIGELSSKFGVEDMLFASKDQSFMASLLFYLGVVTLGERDFMGRLSLRIPNLVIRRLYIERFREMVLPEYEDKEKMRNVSERFYHSGDIQPLCDFIENRYFQVFDNRDYQWANELVIKSAFLTILFSDTFYIMDSEKVLNKGYADLSLIVRPDMRKYQLLDHVLEFKFLKLAELNMTGKQIRGKSREKLAQLPVVQQALDEAEIQLQSYRNALHVRHQNQLHLHTYGVVALGFERLVFRHLGKCSESILCHDQTHTLLDKSTEPEFKP